MSTTLQLRTSTSALPFQWPRLSPVMRATMKRMIAARQAKADRIVKEQLARLGLPHPRDLHSQVLRAASKQGEGT